jgi:hypothetical protein
MPAKSEQVFNRFKQRGKDKPYRTAEQLKALGRVAQLTRIYKDQYPKGLPHNDLGVKYAKYMLRTLAFFETIKGRERWLDRYVPWIDADRCAAILNMSPHWYSKKSLGQHFELYDEDRERLQAWSIEAVDVDEDQRDAINREKQRKAKERNRRKRNIRPREQYLESVKSQQPWKALKLSRTEYYRRGLHLGTGSEIALSLLDTNPEPSPKLPESWPNCTNHVVYRRDGVTVRTLQDRNAGISSLPSAATSTIPIKHKEAA